MRRDHEDARRFWLAVGAIACGILALAFLVCCLIRSAQS